MIESLVHTMAEWVGWAIPLDFMQVQFMQYAFLALLLLAPLSAVFGLQVINSRMSFFSDAIAHSSFAGVALGLIFCINVNLSMSIVAVLVGLIVIYLNSRSGLSSDTVTGIVFSAVSAFGLAVISLNRSVASNLQVFLFGDILTITTRQIFGLSILLLASLIFQILSFNRILLIGINPMLAAVHKVRVSVYRVFMAILLSMVVICSVRTAGVILVTALLIVPAAAARNLSKNISAMFYWALGISYFSCITGFFISTQPWAPIPAGTAIVLCSVVIYVFSQICAFFRPKRVADSDI